MRNLKYFLLALVFPLLAYGTISEVNKQDILYKSMVFNGGFENGKQGWTASGGTFATVTGASTNKLSGDVSGTWDSGSAGQTLTSRLVTIPKGLYGNSSTLRCKLQTPSGTATHTLGLWDGTTLFGTVTVNSSTTPKWTYSDFIMPSSGTLAIRSTSVNADEPLVAIDDCSISEAVGISNVSQARLVGASYWPTTASCAGWSRGTTTVGAFSTDSDCPGPTVITNDGPGVFSTTDSDLPRQTVNNLPPGTCEACFEGNTASSTTQVGQFAIYDGTTVSPMQHGSGGNGTGSSGFNVCSVFKYTAAGSRAYELYGAADNGSVSVPIDNKNQTLAFRLKCYPSSPDLLKDTSNSDTDWVAYTPTFTGFGTPTGVAYSWRRVGENIEIQGNMTTGTTTATPGRISLPGSLVIGSTSGATMTNTLVGAFTTPSAGQYFGVVQATTGNGYVDFGLSGSSGSQLAPSTNASGIIGSSIFFTMYAKLPIAGWRTSNRAPQLINSVISPSSGVERIVRARIAMPGTPAVTDQTGSWISSLTDNAAGDVTINITAGTFSATPTCVCSIASTTMGRQCEIDTTTATSSSVVRVSTMDSSNGSRADFPFTIICMGPN